MDRGHARGNPALDRVADPGRSLRPSAPLAEALLLARRRQLRVPARAAGKCVAAPSAVQGQEPASAFALLRPLLGGYRGVQRRCAGAAGQGGRRGPRFARLGLSVPARRTEGRTAGAGCAHDSCGAKSQTPRAERARLPRLGPQSHRRRRGVTGPARTTGFAANARRVDSPGFHLLAPLLVVLPLSGVDLVLPAMPAYGAAFAVPP